MKDAITTLTVIICTALFTESSAVSLFDDCPDPWTTQSSSRQKIVWWSPPRVQHHLVSSVRRIGPAPGSVFTAGSYAVLYEATGFDGSKSTCQVTFTVQVIECPPIPHIGRSILRCTNDNIWPSRCDFYCPSGFKLSCEQSTTFCTKEGVWSPGKFPICQKKTCTDLRRPSNSLMTCTSTIKTQGTCCRFSCDSGYNISGSSLRTCVQGRWTGVQPVCKDERLLLVPRCPRNIRATAEYGTVFKRVSYPLPEALDKRPIQVRLVSGQESGTLFRIGQNRIHLLLVDEAGNIGHCRFYVQVVDKQPPRFTYCPEPIYTYCDPQTPGIVVTYDTPVAVDNSSPEPINVTRAQGPESGATLSPGVYPVQYTAYDDADNYAECAFFIMVKGISCTPLADRNLVEQTCSRDPPYIHGTWCEFRCTTGRLVGSPTRSCGKDGWTGQDAVCIGMSNVPGSALENTTSSSPFEYDGTPSVQ